MTIQEQINSLESQIKELTDKKKALEKELFLSNVKNSAEGKTALSLFNQGYRLVNWGASLTDTDEEIFIILNGKSIGYWADGTNRNSEEVYSLLNLEDNEFNEEVLSILCDLSED
jgi:hypothetical protein